MARPKHAQEQASSAEQEWQTRFRQIEESSSPDSKTAIVGVGHPLRGDDFVGSHIAKSLLKRVGESLAGGIFFFDAEDNVERVISKVGTLNPKHVVFIDACEMNAPAGEIRLVSIAKTDYSFFTTHGIPLKMLAQILLPSSEAWVFAIQPAAVGVGDRLSPAVSLAAKSIADFISSLKEERAVA